MYKRFLEQHITHYNRKWYCYICKLTLESIAKVEHHLQEAHQNINNKISGLQNLSNEKCKQLLHHGIVLKNISQDYYFCLPCHCSLPSLNHIDMHLIGKRHTKCIQKNVKIKNKQQDSHDKPVCKTELVQDLSNNCIQMTSKTSINDYVSYPLMQEVMCTNFFIQNITRYGQWYCSKCKSPLQNLAEAECHLQEVHPNNTKILDFSSDSDELLDTEKYRKLLNDEISQNYFCSVCQCLISLNNFEEHFKGKRHTKCIQKNAKIKNKQQDLHDKPVCKTELVQDLSNCIQMTSKTSINDYVSYPLMQEVMCKNFVPSGGSNLAAIFGLKSKLPDPYSVTQTAPKKTNTRYNIQQTTPSPKTEVLIAKAVHAFKLQNGHYVSIGKYGIALTGNVTTKLYQIILYKSKQEYISVATVTHDFVYTIQAHNYASYYDNNKDNWSILFENNENYLKFAAEVGLARYSVMQERRKNIDAHFKGKRHTKCIQENAKIKDKQDSHDKPVCKTELVQDLSNNCIQMTSKTSINDYVSYPLMQEVMCTNFFTQNITRYVQWYCCKYFSGDSDELLDIEKYRKLLNDEILQNYFCPVCQCLISLDNFEEHFKGKKHTKCIQKNAKIKKQDSHDKPVCKTELVQDLSNNCIQMTNKTNINDYVSYPLMQEVMCTNFFTQNITRYGQWYCCKCESPLQSLAEAECHLQEVHPNNTKILDFSSDSDELLDTEKYRKLLNDEISQNYFCSVCQCLTSLDNFEEHFKGKRHTQCIITARGSKNIQQNSNNNADAKHNEITPKIETQLKHVKSNFSAEVLSIFENPSNNNILNSFETKEKNISVNKLEEYNVNNNQHSLITTTNTNSKNIAICQEERISGLYMSRDIAIEIDRAIAKPIQRRLQSRQKKENHKSALDRYNKMYKKRFLHFEDVIFVYNKKKLDEFRSNLKFYVSYFNDMSVIKTMCCFLCNFTHSYDIHNLYKHINCLEHVTQLKQLNANNKQRKLSQELIKIESSYAKCYACNKNINNNAVTIEKHIHSCLHKKNRKQKLEQTEDILKEFKTLWYSIQYFACVVCNIRFRTKIVFMEHLDAKHKTILNTNDNSKFDFCLTCATLWYDDKNLIKTYLAHCATRTHRYLAEHNCFTVTPLPQMLRKLLQNVDKTVADLFEQYRYMLHDKRPEQLKNALKKVFKSCDYREVEVCVFGSRFTGLAFQNSDIDIYLNFGYECTKTALIKDRMEQILDCLGTELEKWEIKSIRDSSRTPIIKMRHRSTGLDCDISFTNGLSLENSKLIKSFNMTYPACHKLILFLKKWLSLGDLTGFNGITNYALTWLVIFYLQIKYNIPSISALIKSHNQSKIVSGWETGIGDTIPDTMKVPELEIQESKQIYKLLLEFFKYYGSFDYMHYIICPLLGEEYRKESFTEGSPLPDSMSPYVTQLQGTKREYFRIDSSMCVQDPFDLAHNLTKAVPILTLKRFKHYCNESALILLELCKKKN